MFRPVRITPPAEMPIDVEDAKAFLRVDGAESDALINSLIASAVDHLDGRAGILGRCLVTQVWQFRSVAFCRHFELNMPGATSAVVRYVDRDGVTQTMPPEHYELVETVRGSCLVFHDTVAVLGLCGRFEYDVTFGTAAADVPRAIVQAIRMLVAHWFANREAVVTGTATALPLGVQALVGPYRWMSVR